MSDLYLNESSGDLDITNGVLRFTSSDREEVRQKVEIRLRTFLGEWFSNINAGIPYFQQMLVRGTNKFLIDSTVRSKVINTEGVTGIRDFKSSISSSDRKYSATFKALTREGAVEISI